MEKNLNRLSISGLQLLPVKERLAALSDLAFEQGITIEKLQLAVEAKNWGAVTNHIGDLVDACGTQVMDIVLEIGDGERRVFEVANATIEALATRPSRGVSRSHLTQVRAAILEVDNLPTIAAPSKTTRSTKHRPEETNRFAPRTMSRKKRVQILRRKDRLASPKSTHFGPTEFNLFIERIALGDKDGAISLALELEYGNEKDRILNSRHMKNLIETHWLPDTKSAAA